MVLLHLLRQTQRGGYKGRSSSSIRSSLSEVSRRSPSCDPRSLLTQRIPQSATSEAFKEGLNASWSKSALAHLLGPGPLRTSLAPG